MGFVYEKDTAGIVTVTMDMDGQSANTMGTAYLVLMRDTLARLEKEEGLTGVIFASAKKTFFAGGDLDEILAVEKIDESYLNFLTENKSMFRRLEQLPVPVVAAINGAAMGGGFELCLGCNWRIASPEASVGLPEVTLGLLPAAGGIVRTVALLGLEKALPVVLEGRPYKAKAAFDYGLVDQLVDSKDALIDAAKAWIQANPQAHTQPWDKKDFKYPGGQPLDMNIRMTETLSAAMLVNKTRGRLPAPEKILDIAVNSMRMGFDAALLAESRGFCSLVTTPHAKAAISTFFLAMQDIKNGRYRPAGDRWKAQSSAVLGAGMMGAGIAWAHASTGLQTHLKDTQLASANKGKAYSENLCDGQIKRGRMDAGAKDKLLGLINPTETNDFGKVDILIEAVFEDIALKEKVIGETFGLVSETGVTAPTPRRCPSASSRKAARSRKGSSASISSLRSTRCSSSNSSMVRRHRRKRPGRPMTIASRSARYRSSSTTAAASSPAACSAPSWTKRKLSCATACRHQPSSVPHGRSACRPVPLRSSTR